LYIFYFILFFVLVFFFFISFNLDIFRDISSSYIVYKLLIVYCFFSKV